MGAHLDWMRLILPRDSSPEVETEDSEDEYSRLFDSLNVSM